MLRHISKTKQTIHIHLHPKVIGSEESVKAREAKEAEEAEKAKEGKSNEEMKKIDEELEKAKQLKKKSFQEDVDYLADFLSEWKLTYELHLGILDSDPKFIRSRERITGEI